MFIIFFSDEFMNKMTTAFYANIENYKQCKNTICTPFTATCQSGFADPHTSISWKITHIKTGGEGEIDVTIPSRSEKICDGEICSTISNITFHEGEKDEVTMENGVVYVVDRSNYYLQCTVTQQFPGGAADVKHIKDGNYKYSAVTLG